MGETHGWLFMVNMHACNAFLMIPITFNSLAPPPFTAMYVRRPHPWGFKTFSLRTTVWQQACNEHNELAAGNSVEERMKTTRKSLQEGGYFSNKADEWGRGAYLSKMHCTSKLSTSHTSMFSSWNTKTHSSVQFLNYKRITVTIIAV